MNARTEPPWSKEGGSLFRMSQRVRESPQHLSCNLNFEKGPSVGEGQMLELEGEMNEKFFQKKRTKRSPVALECSEHDTGK